MLETLVNVDVDNLEEAIEFYGCALGLQVGRRFGGTIVEMLGASSRIYLLEKPAGSSATESAEFPRNYRRHWTPVHLDFVVTDIEHAVQQVLAAGAQLESAIQTHAWGRIAMFGDPFGHGFCLLEFKDRGYDEIAQDGG